MASYVAAERTVASGPDLNQGLVEDTYTHLHASRDMDVYRLQYDPATKTVMSGSREHAVTNIIANAILSDERLRNVHKTLYVSVGSSDII